MIIIQYNWEYVKLICVIKVFKTLLENVKKLENRKKPDET